MICNQRTLGLTSVDVVEPLEGLQFPYILRGRIRGLAAGKARRAKDEFSPVCEACYEPRVVILL